MNVAQPSLPDMPTVLCDARPTDRRAIIEPDYAAERRCALTAGHDGPCLYRWYDIYETIWSPLLNDAP